jgi:hypothetical protein
MKGTANTRQESAFSEGQWYLIDNEGMVWKRYQHNNNLVVLSGRQVLPKQAYSQQKAGKYYQLEDGKLLFIEENRP